MENINTDILLEKPKDFKSITEYNNILKKYKTKINTRVKAGYFYSFDYDFSLDYDKDVVKYFDTKPLDLIFTVKDSNHFYGLNFHFLPLMTRSWFLNKLKSMNSKKMDSDKPEQLIISYNTITSIMKKSKYCVRQYRNDRVSKLKELPAKEMFELVKYQIESFYAVYYDEVLNRHRTYKI